MRSLRGSLAGLPLLTFALTALILAAGPAYADQKSCRRCNCDVTLTGETDDLHGGPTDPAEHSNILKQVSQKATGGDEGYWTSNPPLTRDAATGAWKGKARIHRLCGNGATAAGSWRFGMFSDTPTVISLGCDCEKSVECLAGSKCEESGL